MKIYQHHHIGKRKNQEDALGNSKNTYVVCDGVGGHNKGEVASNFVLDSLKKKTAEKEFISVEELEAELENIQLTLNAQLDQNPEWEKMGTTLVGLTKVQSEWYSFHIGDSRLMWARPSKQKIWHTWDHSFVSQLVKMSEITREDGRFHPRSNEIQRAIMANIKGKTVKAEIQKLAGLQKDDIILLCSDGITEVWSDYELSSVLLNDEVSFEEKAEIIFSKASAQANDNNTGILLEVTENQPKKDLIDSLVWIPLKALEEDFKLYKDEITDIEDKDSEESDGDSSSIKWNWKFWR